MVRIFKASLLEKTRTSTFVMLLVAILFIVVVCTPQYNSTIQVLAIDPSIFKQATNSSWLSMSAALIFGIFQLTFGYVFIKNSISMDSFYGVSQLLSTIPFHRLRYVYGKYLANFTILLFFWLTTMFATLGMQAIRFPGKEPSISQFMSPFLVLLPGMAFIAFFAIVSDVIPIFQKSIGTTLGILFLVFLYVVGLNSTSKWLKVFDVSGTSYLTETIARSVNHSANGKALNDLMIFANMKNQTKMGKRDLIILPVNIDKTDLVLMLSEIALVLVFLTLIAYLLKRRSPLLSFKLMKISNTTRTTKITSKSNFMTRKNTNFIPVTPKKFNYFKQILLEINLIKRSTTRIVQILLFVVWLVNWISPISIEKKLIPMTFLLLTQPFAQLGNTGHLNELFSWLRTLPNGQNHKLNSETIAGLITAFVMTLPMTFKMPEIALLLLCFETATVLLFQLQGLFLNQNQLITLITILFWFIYLNGITILFPVGDSKSLSIAIFYALLAAILWIAIHKYSKNA